MLRALLLLDTAIFRICRWGVIVCLALLFLLLAAGVLTRLVPVVSITGYDELVELFFAWLIFLGAPALARDAALYRVTLVVAALPAALRRPIELLVQLLVLVFALTLAVEGTRFMLGAGETTPFLRLDKSWWYAAMPVAGVSMAAYAVCGLVRVLRREQDATPAGGDLLG